MKFKGYGFAFFMQFLLICLIVIFLFSCFCVISGLPDSMLKKWKLEGYF
uniref:Uncharacterized protein n=1 Tax=Rhizophora mucronata TaxID=61149 RepID=A0A2P2Q590_RHIMU